MTFKPTPDPADPDSTPPDEGLRMGTEDLQAEREWLLARRSLVVELPPLAGVCILLTELAPAAEASVLDARMLWVACFSLFSMALLDFMHRALGVLAWECPRCAEPFCGHIPFRTRCAHCGFRPGSEGGRT